MSESNSTELKDWKPTPRQVDRYQRTKDKSMERKVPHFPLPLYVDDEDEVALREGLKVARRILVLWEVARRADGESKAACLNCLDSLDLWEEVSPQERRFLLSDRPDNNECRDLVWRLESIWVLLWAICLIEQLDWPTGMCNVPFLRHLVQDLRVRPQQITHARMRTKTEILDAQSLTMHIHWAIRDAWLHHRLVPERLIWSEKGKMVPASQCPGVGVIEQRHHTLNWLTCLDGADWDDVDTST